MTPQTNGAVTFIDQQLARTNSNAEAPARANSVREIPAAAPGRRLTLNPDVDPAVASLWTGETGPMLENHFRGVRREMLALLRAARDKKQAPLVLVTSALPNDGKTFVSSAVARTFAQSSDFNVNLMDFDFIRRSSSAMFGATQEPGLAECARGLVRADQIAVKTAYARVKFIPAGKSDGDPREIYVGDALDGILDHFRRGGPTEICILDAPPVLPVVETALVATKVDLVLLVVRAGLTPKQAVIDAIVKLGQNVKLCVVMNSVASSHTGEYYDYYSYDSPPRGGG